ATDRANCSGTPAESAGQWTRTAASVPCSFNFTARSADKARSRRWWMTLRLAALLVSLVLLAPATGLADTLITAPSLVNRTPGADFHLGTGDDGIAQGTVGPHASGANVRGAASYLLLKMDGTIPANGNDFDYIIFFDGTMDLSLDMLASTATTAVMNITG